MVGWLRGCGRIVAGKWVGRKENDGRGAEKGLTQRRRGAERGSGRKKARAKSATFAKGAKGAEKVSRRREK